MEVTIVTNGEITETDLSEDIAGRVVVVVESGQEE